jgi:hypothetical protein
MIAMRRPDVTTFVMSQVCGNNTVATGTTTVNCAACPLNSQAIGRTAVSHSLQTNCLW